MENVEDEEEEDDDDGGFSWLKEMGVQDKIKKPDSITIKLYPFGVYMLAQELFEEGENRMER